MHTLIRHGQVSRPDALLKEPETKGIQAFSACLHIRICSNIIIILTFDLKKVKLQEGIFSRPSAVANNSQISNIDLRQQLKFFLCAVDAIIFQYFNRTIFQKNSDSLKTDADAGFDAKTGGTIICRGKPLVFKNKYKVITERL